MHDVCGASVQEVPKYLKGRHNCTREDMIHLGGLLFRIQVDSDKSGFVAIPKMLKDLVPADQINLMTPEDWKKVKRVTWWRRESPEVSVILLYWLFRAQHIVSSYKDQSGITVEEAKIRFLKAASTWPTFGCSFFEAKVRDVVTVGAERQRCPISPLCSDLSHRSKRARRASPTPSWSWSAKTASASRPQRRR